MKTKTLLLLASFGVPAHANTTALVPVTNDTLSGFSYSIRNSSDQISNTFMTTESIKFQFHIKIKKHDIGEAGSLYLVAHYKDKWYQKTVGEGWQQWNQQINSLLPFKNKILAKEENIIVLNNEILSSGEFLVYGAYKTDKDQQIFYNKKPATMLVFDQSKTALHRVKNNSLFESYFAHGIKGNPKFFFTTDTGDFSGPLATTFTLSGEGGSVSQTNLQETGVDEADRIKTDGNNLYALENCANDQNKQCITFYAIQASPAANTKLQQLEIGSTSSLGNLYLSQVNEKKILIHIGNSSNYKRAFDGWYFPGYWQGQQTDIKLVDISQPQNTKINLHITLDSRILSSRLIDGVLYLVTRKNSYFTFPADTLPVVSEGKEIIPNPTVPKDQTINNLLPTISFNEGVDAIPVVQATDCYIPNKTSEKQVDNTVITITAIPLDNPKAYYSSCIAGAVDTFYMSTKALYLATTQHHYAVSGNTISFAPELSNITTEIHKFALAKGHLDYRGSGSVEGHLGWKADKRPFRMGEYNEILKVATSKGNAWDNSSTTRVSVLSEAKDSKSLKQISFLDNLGKPGERLFAARFIKDRGYLVTFKQTDPLYVLDFTQPEQPAILGALEINGYSDYLHPIGDDFLLGIGKDALPNTDNPDQGAFYQGVKLSLFDVSSAANLREVSSVVIGKRGTESAVLSDHHALAWLPSKKSDTATLAIPIQLNNQKLSGGQYDYSQPAAHYGWTHTGLYTFNMTSGADPSIELQGKLISDKPPEQCNEPGSHCSFKGQYTHNDRAVIQDKSIHYIHNNKVFSSAIKDLK